MSYFTHLSCFCLLALCLKAQLCVSTQWLTSEMSLMALSPINTDTTTNGLHTQGRFPILVREQWVSVNFLKVLWKFWNFTHSICYCISLCVSYHLTGSMISFMAIRVFSLKDKQTQKHVHCLTDFPSVFHISVREAHSHQVLSPQKSSQMKRLTSFVLILSCTTLCIPFTSALWLVRSGVDYRFTTIAVDQVDAVDGRYEVLFLGTGESGIFWMLTLVKFLSESVKLQVV